MDISIVVLTACATKTANEYVTIDLDEVQQLQVMGQLS